MVIVDCNGDGLAGDNPWLSVFKELHVTRWASDSNSHFAGTKYHPISSAPVGDDVNESLETFGSVGGDIGVVGHTAPAHVDVVCLLYTSPSPRDS